MKFGEKVFRRLRLKRICKKLGIKPYPFQEEFALGLTDRVNSPPGRATGKTMAVMLRLLILSEEDDHPVNALLALGSDPDWHLMKYHQRKQYIQQYVYMCRKCAVPAKFSQFTGILIFGHD